MLAQEREYEEGGSKDRYDPLMSALEYTSQSESGEPISHKRPRSPNEDEEVDEDAEPDSEEDHNGPSKSKQHKKPKFGVRAKRYQPPKRDIEESMAVALDDEVQPKKGRGKSTKSNDPDTGSKFSKKPARPSKAKNTNPNPKAPRRSRAKKAAKDGNDGDKTTSNRRLCADGPDMADVPSLFTSNVFKDAEGNEGRADQPTFTNTRKDQALKELIASVPEDVRKTAQITKNYLLAATKDFMGRGAVKADGKGGWLVNGMESSLKHYQLLGASYMRRKENGVDPQGGLCADQMGLGSKLVLRYLLV